MQPNDIIVDRTSSRDSCLSRHPRPVSELDYLEGGETIDEFLTISRRSQRKRRLRRSTGKTLLVANWDEDPAGQCLPRKPKYAFLDQLPNRATGLAGGEWILLSRRGRRLRPFLTDKGRNQQNLAGRRIAVLIVRARSNRLVDLLPHLGRVDQSSVDPARRCDAGWRNASRKRFAPCGRRRSSIDMPNANFSILPPRSRRENDYQ